MPLIMHGNWTISVKEKNAAFPQRFIVSGAIGGNGAYVAPHAPVTVTGNTWSLRIQSDPTGPESWTDSEYQITFPVKAGSQYQFDLQSNDVWIGDKDFNDLVLTLSTAVTETDFLVYGHVSSYAGCWYNPCYPGFILIETEKALSLARRHYGMREIVDKYYPRELIRWPIPLPDPPPDIPVSVLQGDTFKPLLIPLQGDTRLPPQKALVVKNTTPVRKANAKTSVLSNAEKAGEKTLEKIPEKIYRTVNLYEPVGELKDLNRSLLGKLFQGGKKLCQVDPLVNAGLRFLEYDRTEAEKLGGEYSGEGSRETLGISSTDRNGNYVFSFHRSVDQFIDEAGLDVVLGEDEHLEKMPDVIVQVLGATLSGGKQFETAPYWNIPGLKRINICIPAAYWYTPTGCHGRPISHIGFIPVGKKSTVSLDSSGRVTCTDTSKADIPQARCAAWRGYLRMSACLGKYDQVPTYTLEYRTKPKGGGWPSSWKIYREALKLDNWNSTLADWIPKSVGPFLHTVELEKGNPQEVWAYNNVQGNMDWAGPDWFLKAIIPSWLYNDPSGPGPVQFRLKGYDVNGKQVVLWVDSDTGLPKTEDVITLFIDNSLAELAFTAPTIGAPTSNPCPLFILTDAQLTTATLDFKFKALHKQGFLGSYTLGLNKCNSGDFPVVNVAPDSHPLREPTSTHSPCTGDTSWTYGTLDGEDASADLNNYVAVQLKPDASQPWLATGEALTIITLKLSASVRTTDGHSAYYPYDQGPILYNLVIQRAP